MKTSPPLLSFLVGAVLPLAAQTATSVNYWDFEDPDPFLDRRGEATSSVTAGTSVTTVPGIRGLQAMNAQTSIGGNDDLVDIDGATLHQPGEESFSFSYWFRIPDDGLGVPRGIFDFSANGQDGVQSLFIDNFTNPNGRPSMAFRIDHDNGGTSLAFVALTEGPGWHFVAATYDPALGLQVHLDGFGVDASAIPVAQPNPVSMAADSYLGSFNFAGATQDKGLAGDLDDFAIYSGVLSQSEIEGLFDGTLSPPDIVAPTPPPRPIGHYWDFDTPGNSLPEDLYGGLATREFGFVDLSTVNAYGEAYPGAGRSLNSLFALNDHLVAETYSRGAPTALDFGSANFAISFWSYNDPLDGSGFGPAVFDFLRAEETGMQMGTDDGGNLNIRIDDDAGNTIVSNEVAGFETVRQPADQWVHVVLNVDRDSDELRIYFNGAAIPEGAIDISSLTGDIFCSLDLQIGVRNMGTAPGGSQDSALDDFAIYPGILSQEQITDLAAATTGPLEILASFEPPTPIPVVSLTRNSGSGELTVVFTSTDGATYSVYGGEDLTGRANWPELTTADLPGNGLDLAFPFTPAGNPPGFYFQIRED